jgi:hypothetical protein
MKYFATALLLAVSFAAPASAQSMNADDMKWINQCINDNKGGAAPAVIRAYCMCMNEKMEENERQSITQWEKSHPRERAACDRQAGWK